MTSRHSSIEQPASYRAKYPLHVAAEYCHLPVVKFLLRKCNYHANKKDNRGETPLHVAVRGGHKEVCKVLLSCEADIYAQNGMRQTALDMAKEAQNQDLFNSLVSHEVDIVVDKNPKSELQEKLERAEILGEGTFGVVRKVMLPSGYYVSVKGYKHNVTVVEGSVPKVMTNAYQELETHKNLQHHNVVKLHRAFIHANTFYLVMEFVEGGNLDRKMSVDGLDQDQVKNISKQLFECLVYLKSVKVIHRDIKPANILITSTDDVKLVDFGLAKAVESLGMTKHSMNGTLDFMAPELFVKPLNYNHKVDVWSTGLVFYQLFTGDDPKFDKTLEEHRQMMVDCGASRDILDIFDKCLHMDPRMRSEPEEILESPYFGAQFVEELNLAATPSLIRELDDSPIDIAICSDSKGFSLNNEGVVTRSHKGTLLPRPCLLINICGMITHLLVLDEMAKYKGTIKIQLDDASISQFFFWDTQRELIMKDTHNNCIHRVSLDGFPLGRTSPDLLPQESHGLCLLNNDRIAVCDTKSRSVLLLSLPDLHEVKRVTTQELNEPWNVTASNHKLYICNSSRNLLNSSLLVLSLTDFEFQWNTENSLQYPHKIAYYCGYIFLTDSNRGRLIQTSTEGRTISSAGQNDSRGDLELKTPKGFVCFCTSAGRHMLAVCDTGNKKLKFYALSYD